MASQILPRITFEQYLEFEQKAEFRSEFIDGQVVAMAGGTPTHAQIQANAMTELNVQLRGHDCGARGSDLLLYFSEFQVATYPDLVVTCGPDKVSDIRKGAVTDATVIIEVLSPSTETYDRTTKFRYYRSLPSFREYLMLSQDRMRAEHFSRQTDGTWTWHEFLEPDSRIHLASIGCVLVLKDLYARVQFENA